MVLWPHKHRNDKNSELILKESDNQRIVVRDALKDLKKVLDKLEDQMEKHG